MKIIGRARIKIEASLILIRDFIVFIGCLSFVFLCGCIYGVAATNGVRFNQELGVRNKNWKGEVKLNSFIDSLLVVVLSNLDRNCHYFKIK